MKTEKGIIVEISEKELFSLYLDREMDDVMSFSEYQARMEHAGCVVVKEAEPVRHGRWETVPNREFDGFETVCRGEAERCTNCCRASKDFKKWFERCPNCGAKMDGGTENA